MIRRWYLLHANFLYVFKSSSDTKAKHVILLHGCQITALPMNTEVNITKNKKAHKNKLQFGIEIVIGINTIRQLRKVLYASSKHEQKRWIHALKSTADAYVVQDFFNLKEPLGFGKFSTVYRALEKKTGKEYAVKIIQRRSLSPRENQALRTEIAVLRLLNHPNVCLHI